MLRPDRRAETRGTCLTSSGTRRHQIVAWAIGLSALALDQLTKATFESSSCGDVICPLRNDELMLGVVGGTTTQVLAASVVGLALFWLWVRVANRRAAIPVVASALVVSGVVGNLIDRVFLGSVRDFLAFPGNTVVNVADLALAVGLLVAVGALIVGLVTKPSAHWPRG